jgi:CBS domain-containing membrane protein
MSTIEVSDLMTSRPFTVSVNDSLQEVYDLMNEHGIRHVPVVTKGRELEGIVTHRDLVNYALFAIGDLPYSEKRAFLKETFVALAMTKNPETIAPDSNIEDAARMMLENKYGCLPVTEGNKIVGILTEADFIKYLLKIRQEEEEQAS